MKRLEIVFVKNSHDVETLIRSGVKENMVLIALTFGAYYKLLEDGLSGTPVWCFIDGPEAKKQLEHHKTLIDECWNPFFINSELEPYKIVPLCSLVFFLQEALISSLVIKRIVNKYNPATFIAYYSHYNIPCDETNWECSTFDSILEYYSENYNILLVKNRKTQPVKITAKNRSRQMLQVCQSIIDYCKGLIVISYWKIVSGKNKDRIFLSLLSEHEEKNRQSWFFEYLKNFPGLNALHLWKGSLKNVKSYSDGFLKKIRNKKRVRVSAAETLKSFFEYRQRLPVFPEILSNNHLAYQWDHLFTQLCNHMIVAQTRAKRLYHIFKPRIALVSISSHPSTIANSVALQSMGTKTALLSHSIMPEINKFYYNFHHYVVASTEFQRKKVLEMEIPEDNIITVPDKRFESLKIKSAPSEALKEQYYTDNKKIITVITRNLQKGTGFFPKDELKYMSLGKQFEFILACKDLTRTIEDCLVFFKSHPKVDHFDFYDQLCGTRVRHYQKEPLHEILDLSDIIIVTGVLTDALFESMVKHKEIVFCDLGMNKNDLDRISDSVRIVEQASDLSGVILEILNEDSTEDNRFQKFNPFLELNPEIIKQKSSGMI